MARPGNWLEILAPAKVNLTLHVVARRPDGYHELESVMQKLELADRLSLRLSDQPGIRLTCPGSDLPEGESNLAFCAARSFLQAWGEGQNPGLEIVLEKRIPVAAGLGGGSSDAGAVFTGLNRLLAAGFSEEALIDLARPLGADVPFFVSDQVAVLARGIGDLMRPVSGLHGCEIVLVNPGFAVSTAWVYGNYALTAVNNYSKLSGFQKNSYGLACPLHNDLEQVTLAHYPLLQEIKQRLLGVGATDVLMSGSGPTIFGLFPAAGHDGPAVSAAVVQDLRDQYGEQVFVTRPLCVGA